MCVCVCESISVYLLVKSIENGKVSLKRSFACNILTLMSDRKTYNFILNVENNWGVTNDVIIAYAHENKINISALCFEHFVIFCGF